jgi:hypothetical protein
MSNLSFQTILLKKTKTRVFFWFIFTSISEFSGALIVVDLLWLRGTFHLRGLDSGPDSVNPLVVWSSPCHLTILSLGLFTEERITASPFKPVGGVGAKMGKTSGIVLGINN